MRSHAAVIGGS